MYVGTATIIPSTPNSSPPMTIIKKISKDESVMVHCAAGMGRAGTILACYFVKYKKYPAKDAIKKIRDERPGSIQSEVQELAIGFYEKHVRN